MRTLRWSDVYYKKIEQTLLLQGSFGLQIGAAEVTLEERLDFGDGRDGISVLTLFHTLEHIKEVTSKSCFPQLAYHIFTITHRPTYMESYFPVTKSLNKDARRQFHETVSKVMLHPGFDLQLLDTHHQNIIKTLPALGYLVAGHIVELFFFRQDILDRLLQGTIRIWLYTDQQAFAADSGVAGGCYNPQKGCVQLVVSRLFEGFNQPKPGVAPFLHEFGHLLDYFDADTLKASVTSSGWLPGMRPSDGAIYTPEAREAFIAGKWLEIQRYDRQVATPDGVDPLPIGHPYVFQSNSEFIAGYLEMFFRNPHYFAAQNRDLYDGFARLFRQDPCQYWEADFPFYVQQNRVFYQSGERPRASGLQLETD